nr:Gag-Pol polyprotein [Tanacetum cinerariifolium]
MELVLMDKALKLNYSTPTNNNQRISSNPRNRQIAQPAQAEGNAIGNNGNQIRRYNCRGLGHLTKNCIVRPKRMDAAYLQTQLLIAKKEEAGIQLQAEEFDLMAAVADLDEIKEVNANYILMAKLQQASTSGTQTDKALVYDPDRSSSCRKNKEVEVEEHHRNLLLSKNKKHMSSECHNVKLAIRNDKSEKQKENVSNIENQKKQKPTVMKPKKVWSNERLASPKPSKPRSCLRNLKLLINFIWKFLETVRFGNDHASAIMGFGDLQWGNILISRVYFVEGLGHNLFSVGQFCDSDLDVTIKRNTCFIRNHNGVDLLKGNHTTNLYTINPYEMDSASPICLMAHATSTKSWLWHQRLSHLNFDTINDLAKNDISNYVLEILKKYEMESCDPIGTPMEIKDKLDLDQNGSPVDATKYRSMIGALMGILRLVDRTVYTLLFMCLDSGFELTEFSDADYARCKDTFKSTFGEAQFLGEKLVSWSSKKQDCVALSTTKAEYVSLSTCCAQVIWMRIQLTDYCYHFNKIPIYCDSKSAIDISCNPVQHSRTKHIVVRYLFIKENMEKGTIELYFVKTDYQLADLFTKSLLVDRFNYLVRRLVLWMRTQLTDYGFHFDKIPMYCDSKAAIAISCNPVQHSRTKHIDVRYHFIKEKVKKGIVELFFVRTEYQLADLFTKALHVERFQYLVRRLGMRCLTPAELEALANESA